MGSGKNTVAQALARILNCRAIDLDQLIKERTGRTPKEIIEQDGESPFREIETHLLRDVLEGGPARVIALGGGAWTMQGNRELIAAYNCFAVWLDAPFELCWQRIAESGSERPLAREEKQAQILYTERRTLYQLAAFHLFADEGKSVDELALTIAKALQRTEP